MAAPAIIVDRDGTLASVAHVAPADRSSIAWAMFNASLPFDAVVPGVLAAIVWARTVMPDLTVIMTSGRMAGDFPGDTRRRSLLLGWIAKHDLPIDILFMRDGGDLRPDSDVKRDFFHNDIAPNFDVLFAIDDRPQVCDMWRDLGVPLVQVVDPGILPPMAG